MDTRRYSRGRRNTEVFRGTMRDTIGIQKDNSGCDSVSRRITVDVIQYSEG